MVALARPPLLVLAWLFVGSCPTAGAHAAQIYPRFQAVETGALLSPRYYPPSPAQPLQKRQNGCSANHHPCIEIGDIGSNDCCANDEYCIVDPENTGRAACCKIGSTCGSPCSESQVQCNGTTTITSSGTTTTSVYPACCGRQCPSTSSYGCAKSFGAGCCKYGETCAPGGRCISTAQTSASESAVVSLIPDGCTTSQITCADSLGGGCCAVTQSCVRIDNRAKCAEATITPTASGITVVPAESELSAGAKAGISVGVIVVAGLVISAVTYMCLRRGRQRRSEAASSSYRPRPTGLVGVLIGGSGGRDMSDMNSDALSHPGGGLPGVVQDYFGPDPQIGPYSDTPHTDHLSPGTTPGVGDRDVRGGAVPIQPHGPADIAAPVEIDSRMPQPSPQPASSMLASPVSEENGGRHSSTGSHNNNYSGGSRYQPPQNHVAVEGTFELYGSDPAGPSAADDQMPTPYLPPSPYGSTGAQASPSPSGGGAAPSPSPG